MWLRQRRRALGKRVGRWALFGLAAVVRRLPEQRALRLADRVGEAMRVLSPRHRRLVLINMTIAFGKERSRQELEALARRYYRYATRSLVEFLTMSQLSVEQIKAKVKLVGCHHLSDALSKGKGCILLTGHYGNWELVGARLAAEGFPINVIARSQADPKVTDLLVGVREVVGMTVIDRDRGGAAGALRALRNNGIVAILLDQNAGDQGIFVDFFGKQASTAAGPAALARRTGAAVVPVFAIRNDDNSHQGLCLPPLELTYGDDKQADIHRNTQIMVKVIEERIRQCPEQWFWMHRRWKKRPPGDREGNPYE